MGWTDSEQLVCVSEEGNVMIYSMQGILLDQFSLGPVPFLSFSSFI